jgi:hypothetical protein
MKKVGVGEAPEYAAPKHFGCATLRLQGKDETGISKFSVAFTHPSWGARTTTGLPQRRSISGWRVR